MPLLFLEVCQLNYCCEVLEPHLYDLLVPYALWALFFSALLLSSDNSSHPP